MAEDKKWILQEPASEELRLALAEYPPSIVDLLVHRGITTAKEAEQFFDPHYDRDVHDPFLFRDMRAAVDRVVEAIGAQERIVVHGDYDADGLSGAVILISTLKKLGATNVDVYLPDREKEGYGLNSKTVDYLYEQETRLIITCDCGISNAQEVAQAKGLGMDVIITDHHNQGPTLPECLILHPKIEGETYPFKHLAGGGVAFKFAQALLRTAKQDLSSEEQTAYEAFEKWLLDMVAIATVADMVPLVGENRALLKYGLFILSQAKRPGLQAILECAGLITPTAKSLNLTSHEIGFVIGPRLNAAGRMSHANAAYAALMAPTVEEARPLAEALEKTNQERRDVTERIVKEAVSQIGLVEKGEPTVLFAYDKSWPMGVVGLIASRVLEKYYLPVFILSELNGKISGSGRSIEGFNCTDALAEARELLAKFGGHAQACGFTLAENNDLPKLKQRFIEYAKQHVTPQQLQRTLAISASLSVSDITWDFFDLLQKFEPYGMDNPKPLFQISKAKIVEVSACGADNKHLRFSVTQDGAPIRKAIAFGFGDLCTKLHPGSFVDLVCEVDLNEWNGNRELQLMIKDMRLTSSL